MNIEKLFKKAEKFFGLEKEIQDKKEQKKEKLKNSFIKKIASLKSKIKKSDSNDKKIELKKQLNVLKSFLKKLGE